MGKEAALLSASLLLHREVKKLKKLNIYLFSSCFATPPGSHPSNTSCDPTEEAGEGYPSRSITLFSTLYRYAPFTL